MDRICELLETVATPEEQRESQATANHLETIGKLQHEVYKLQTNLASAEDQLALATARAQASAGKFRIWPLLFAFIVGYFLAWLKFGSP
jgi:predicted  nucleic acid-binding Zn-ribbon protein